VSAAKKDRTTAPRLGSRPSKAKDTTDRNVKPPAGYRPAGKRKPGEAAMRAQLAADHSSPVRDPVEGTTSDPSVIDLPTNGAATKPHEQLSVAIVDPDDVPPPKDLWWTDEREKAFQMVLQGIPQHQVAGELGRDRHTVGRWMEDERFEVRLYEENVARFKASRQRRSVQTLRLTDKAERLAGKMLDKAIDLAERGEDQLGVRLAARDWLQEFRENSRREDEIFGLAKERVDVNVHGQVQHNHKGKVGVTFKAFLATSLQGMGVALDAEVDGSRADEALASLAERALAEGTFLDDLVEREKKDKLGPVLAGER